MLGERHRHHAVAEPPSVIANDFENPSRMMACSRMPAGGDRGELALVQEVAVDLVGEDRDAPVRAMSAMRSICAGSRTRPSGSAGS
jgi:hypothetical protein